MSRKAFPTHFLCLPLVTPVSRPQLQASLSRFAADVSKQDENGNPRIPARALRPIGALHFTIGVMSLQNSDRVQSACNFLKNLDVWDLLREAGSSTASGRVSGKKSSLSQRPIHSSTDERQPSQIHDYSKSLSNELTAKPDPLFIALTNLSPMQSPIATSSLYASPNPIHPIYHFAQRLHDIFLDAGFLAPPPGNRQFKLHATLVNTIYVKKGIASGKKRWAKGSGKIDASGIIGTWEETTWAEDIRLEKVAICEMGAKEVKDEQGNVIDEAYTEIASIALP